MTAAVAKIVIAEAKALTLSGADFIASLGPDKVAAAYNGIGPEWLPERFRKKLDKWFDTYRTACVIHDCRFAHDNDGTDAKFRAANDELERNAVIIADDKYAWYNPLRYLARARGRHLADACRVYGWTAWTDAYKTNQKEAK